MIFEPHFQNYDSDTHQHMDWGDISRPSDAYSEPIDYRESATYKIMDNDQ